MNTQRELPGSPLRKFGILRIWLDCKYYMYMCTTAVDKDLKPIAATYSKRSSQMYVSYIIYPHSVCFLYHISTFIYLSSSVGTIHPFFLKFFYKFITYMWALRAYGTPAPKWGGTIHPIPRFHASLQLVYHRSTRAHMHVMSYKNKKNTLPYMHPAHCCYPELMA